MEHAFDISFEDGIASPLSEEELCADCAFVLEQEGVERPCMVSVSVVCDERIRELNASWRGIDRATDVISLECERPDDPDLAPGEPCELGDIVLAPDYITRQAAEVGTTVQDECRLLLVHGMLHLLGYDHMEPDEKAVMRKKEESVMSLIGLTRI